jgi:hypothetical protein
MADERHERQRHDDPIVNQKRTTPAMAAGVASYPWSLTQLAELLD